MILNGLFFICATVKSLVARGACIHHLSQTPSDLNEQRVKRFCQRHGLNRPRRRTNYHRRGFLSRKLPEPNMTLHCHVFSQINAVETNFIARLGMQRITSAYCISVVEGTCTHASYKVINFESSPLHWTKFIELLWMTWYRVNILTRCGLLSRGDVICGLYCVV